MTFDARPWLAELDTPTFVLTGNFDPVVPISAGRDWLARYRVPSCTTCPGGHLAHLVQAKRVGELIEGWARDLQ